MPQWTPDFFVLVCGLCFGSFFNVVICRLPAGRSISRPGSHCPRCKTPIRFYDNIPVVSYLILMGKCRSCGTGISPRYPLVELMTGVLFFFLYQRYAFAPGFFVEVLFVSLLLVVAFIDLDTYIIPDKLSLPGIALGFAASFFTPRVTWLESLLGMVVGGGVLFVVAVLYRYMRKQDGMGGGDIKLLAMIGSFVGATGVVFTILASSMVGTVFGLVTTVRSHKQMATAVIPFGPFLSMGAIVYLFWGERMLDWYLGLFLAH